MRRALFVCLILIILSVCGFTALFYQIGEVKDALRGRAIPPGLSLDIKRIVASMTVTITISSATAGKSATATVTGETEQEIRDKAAILVGIANERWGVTDSVWTI